jgi:hypothetical protein
MPPKGIVPDFKVEISEVENGDKYYRQFAFPDLDIAGGETEKYVDLLIPYDFWFLAIEYYSGPGSGAVLGDCISALVSPVLPIHAAAPVYGLPATVGEIKAALNVNDIKVSVDPLIIGNEDLIEAFFRIGTILQFEDPASAGNPHDSEYVVTAINRDDNELTLASYDKVAKTFTATNVVQEAYANGSKIWRTVVAGDNIHVLPGETHHYGQAKIGASKLPANTTFRICYKKKSGDTDPRTIHVNIEGLVGDREG